MDVIIGSEKKIAQNNDLAQLTETTSDRKEFRAKGLCC
jgi:hypothetical protein